MQSGDDQIVFDPNYLQVLVWERFMKGNYNKNDILLLNHELFKSKYMKKYGATYEQGHTEAQKYYNLSDSVFEERGGDKHGCLRFIDERRRSRRICNI